MKLSLVLRQAKSGELRSLSLKDKTDSVIVDYINLALVALYGRFDLSNKEAIVCTRHGKTTYTLDGNDPDVINHDGTPIEPGSVMIINAIHYECCEVAVNFEDDLLSVHTPTYNTVQFPTVEDGEYASIIYKKNPTLIEFEDGVTNADDVVVPLPVQLLEPLLHYIGYRAHGSVDGQINKENNTHYMRYVASCDNIEQLGLINKDDVYRYNCRKGFMV